MHLGDTRGTHIPFYIPYGATFYAFETTSALQCDISVPSRPLTPPKNPAFRSRGSSFLRISRFCVHTPFRLLFVALSIDLGALWAAPRKLWSHSSDRKCPPASQMVPPKLPRRSHNDPKFFPKAPKDAPGKLLEPPFVSNSLPCCQMVPQKLPKRSPNDPKSSTKAPTAPHCHIRVSLHSLSTVRDGFCYLSADFAHVFRMRHALHGFLQQHLLGRPQNSHKRSECILPPLFAHFLAKLLQPHLRISIYFFTPPHRHFSFAFKLCR